MRHTYSFAAKRFSRIVLFAAVCLLVFGFANQASAQEIVNKNIYYYMPPSDGSGLVNAWGSDPVGHLGIFVGTHVDRAEQPLEWTDPEGATHILMYDQTAVQALFGIGIFDFLNISAAVPYAVSRTFDEEYRGKIPRRNVETGNIDLIDVEDRWETTALGDIRVAGKYIFRDRQVDQWGLAFAVEAGLPTGDKAQFVSDEQFTISPRAIFDLGNTWWTYVLNISYKYYPENLKAGLFELEGGNELIINTGAALRFYRYFELTGEFSTRTLFEDFYSNENIDYGEFFVALRSTFGVRNPFRLTVGSGFGALDGVGTPQYRLFLGLDIFVREIGLP